LQRTLVQPVTQLRRNLVTHVTKLVKAMDAGAYLYGIIKRPVQCLQRKGVDMRAVLFGLLTHDNRVVEPDFAEKLTQALRVQHAGVNADFLKHLPGEVVYSGRGEARARDLEAIPPIVTQQ